MNLEPLLVQDPYQVPLMCGTSIIGYPYGQYHQPNFQQVIQCQNLLNNSYDPYKRINVPSRPMQIVNFTSGPDFQDTPGTSPGFSESLCKEIEMRQELAKNDLQREKNPPRSIISHKKLFIPQGEQTCKKKEVTFSPEVVDLVKRAQQENLAKRRYFMAIRQKSFPCEPMVAPTKNYPPIKTRALSLENLFKPRQGHDMNIFMGSLDKVTDKAPPRLGITNNNAIKPPILVKKSCLKTNNCQKDPTKTIPAQPKTAKCNSLKDLDKQLQSILGTPSMLKNK